MRIVEYNGVPVKRQRKINANEIKVVFYDREPITVTTQDWEKNSQDKFFNDPDLKRCEVVRRSAH